MPTENSIKSGNLSRTTIWTLAGAGVVVFFVPLVFGGWAFPGFPTLPKALSQFRNPFLGLVGLSALFSLYLLLIRRPWMNGLKFFPADRLVGPLLGIYLLAFLKAAFLDYAAFALNAIDFSMYDFAMENTLRGRFMEAVTGVNHFGIHATPILFLLLPLHALFQSPLFVLFLHPIVLWLGALALDRLVVREKIGGWPRVAILFAYLNCGLVSKTLHYGFHVEVFYPLAAFLLYGAIRGGKTIPILAALALFLSIKEDAPFYASGIFLASAVTHKISKRGAGIGVAISFFVLVFYLRYLIPANSETGSYTFAGAAAGFGSSPTAALAGAIHHPGLVLKNFFTAGWWALILPAIGLLARSPFFWIAALPFFGIYSLAGSPLMSGLALYYGMAFVPILFIGWIEGLNHEVSPKRAALWLILAVLGTTLFGGGYLVFRRADLGRLRSFSPIAQALENESALPKPPEICAPGVLIPHLGYLTGLRLLKPTCLETADEVVLFTPTPPIGQPALSTYPLDLTEYADLSRRAENWPLVAKSGEFSLRRRPGSDMLETPRP